MSGGVTVLTGGIGGAKLVLGLASLPDTPPITAIVNTGDDFRHLGLAISPDIDTLLYTLSGKADPERGWGRAGETWNVMAALTSLGGEIWFNLGDGDLALHVIRTSALGEGSALTDITRGFAAMWTPGISILPMSDDPVATMIYTDEGMLSFQHYFVRERCEPAVRHILFEGAEKARPAPGVIEAIRSPETGAIIIAPSNPYLSIDPILAVPGIREALAESAAPVIVVSPIIGGRSIKGPTAKIMAELAIPSDVLSIARHYDGIVEGMLVDSQDAHIDLPVRTATSDILMRTLNDKMRVAQAALDLAVAIRLR